MARKRITDGVGERCRQARENAKLTQVQMVERLERRVRGVKVNQSILSGWETGRSRVPDEVVRAIAHETGTAAGFLTHAAESGCKVPNWWQPPNPPTLRPGMRDYEVLTAGAPRRRRKSG